MDSFLSDRHARIIRRPLHFSDKMWVVSVAFFTSLFFSTGAATAGGNPFQGGPYYVNPSFQKELQASIDSLNASSATRANLEKMASTASAFWIDKKSKITMSNSSKNSTDTVEGILADAATQATPPLVTFIVYDAPNRDCAAAASDGEVSGDVICHTQCANRTQGIKYPCALNNRRLCL